MECKDGISGNFNAPLHSNRHVKAMCFAYLSPMMIFSRALPGFFYGGVCCLRTLSGAVQLLIPAPIPHQLVNRHGAHDQDHRHQGLLDMLHQGFECDALGAE